MEPLPASSHTHTDKKEGHPQWPSLHSDGVLGSGGLGLREVCIPVLCRGILSMNPPRLCPKAQYQLGVSERLRDYGLLERLPIWPPPTH